MYYCTCLGVKRLPFIVYVHFIVFIGVASILNK